MKIFVSWSGRTSRQIAEFLYGWLPSVVQAIEPRMSSADVAKGERWSFELDRMLEVESAILCLTPTNLRNSSMLFEAGALANRAGGAGFVVALLYEVSPTQIEAPLQQFQAISFGKEELWGLVKRMNSLCPVPVNESSLVRSFERNYHEVVSAVDMFEAVLKREKRGETQPRRPTDEILSDLLSTQRSLFDKLNSIDRMLRRLPYKVESADQLPLLPRRNISQRSPKAFQVAQLVEGFLRSAERGSAVTRGDFLGEVELLYGVEAKGFAESLLQERKLSD